MAEPAAAFEREADRQAASLSRLQQDTAGEVLRLLQQARRDIQAKLKAQPTDYNLWHLPQLNQAIGQLLREFGEDAAQAAADGQAGAFDAGQALVDRPLAAAGIELAGLSPQLDKGVLLAMQHFTTAKLKGVALDAVNRVNAELALTVIGAQTPHEAIARIQSALEGSPRSRAVAIVRTELGRAYGVAAQQRLAESAAHVPGLKKRWRRSGKLHSRRSHDLTDGQVRPWDQPFVIGTGSVADDYDGGGVRMMHPHDPKGPVSEVVNCGCVMLPHLEDFQAKGLLQNPGKKPFSAQETAINPLKADLHNLGNAPALEVFQQHLDKLTGQTATLQAPKFRRVLRDVEQGFGTAKIEKAVVLDKAGNILSQSDGDAETVGVPANLLKGAIVTHTHVDIGSFSDSDIAVAMRREMAEIRAVDPKYTYIMRPGKDGWNADLWDNVVAPLFEDLEAQKIGHFFDLMDRDKATKDDFLENSQHNIWRQISREVGLRYTRRKRS